MTTIYLDDDEYDNLKNWEREENIRREILNKIAEDETKGIFDDFPDIGKNPYLNDLLKKTFRKVKLLILVGSTIFERSTPGVTYTYGDYDHREEIGGELYA